MNCFQFDYFCGYHTAVEGWGDIDISLWIAFNLITFVDITQLYVRWGFVFLQLWIAFNLITFVDITQRSVFIADKHLRCELLSIWLLLWISHSAGLLRVDRRPVVNCFQFDYFCGYHTAVVKCSLKSRRLWIAFNLITFVDITQHQLESEYNQKCCELLSIWLLLWISHSWDSWRRASTLVVNCFQFDYFCGYHTAKR